MELQKAVACRHSISLTIQAKEMNNKDMISVLLSLTIQAKEKSRIRRALIER